MASADGKVVPTEREPLHNGTINPDIHVAGWEARGPFTAAGRYAAQGGLKQGEQYYVIIREPTKEERVERLLLGINPHSSIVHRGTYDQLKQYEIN